MKERARKWVSLLLSVCMIISLFPVVTMDAAAAVEVSTWSQLITALATGGKVKLTGDVDGYGWTDSPEVGGSVELDLNGYRIDRRISASKAYYGEGDSRHFDEFVIKVYSGATLTITDSKGGGKITNRVTSSNGYTNWYGGGIYVDGGTLILKSGTITDCYALDGGAGVYVTSGGTMEMSGGTIEGNAIIGSNYGCGGAGVFVTGSGSTFKMSGGSIKGNNALFGCSYGVGGGVYIANGASMEMSGGSISGNWARHGCGVYLSHASMEMSGGSISGNDDSTWSGNGGGVALADSSSMKMSGGSITGNSADLGGGVFIYPGSSMEMSGGSVTKNKADSNGGGFYLSVGAKLNLSDRAKFNENTASKSGNEFFVESDTSATSATITGMDAEGRLAWYLLQTELQKGGTRTIKLTQNVTCMDQTLGYLSVPKNSKITLDLNGFTLSRGLSSATADGSVIMVPSGSTLIISDGSANGGGRITGGYTEGSGGGVYVDGGVLELKKGNITGCIAGSNGGGVFLNNNAEFKLSGSGIVEGNSAYDGGGVYLSAGAKFTMSGGSINNNVASRNGGGVYFKLASKLNELSGGTITKNKASVKGGGVFLDHVDFNTKYSDRVKDNSARSDKDVCVSSDSISMANYSSYILEAVTGEMAGDNVRYFAVRYLDNNGKSRVEFIFPSTDLKASYAAAAKKSDKAKSVLEALEKLYCLQPKEGDSYLDPKPLQPYHRDMYIFTPKYQVKEITGIEFFGRYVSGTKNGWDCQGLRIYGVNQIHGLDVLGGFSTQYFIDFSGELLVEMEVSSGNTSQSSSAQITPSQAGTMQTELPKAKRDISFQWSYGSDELFRIGTDAGYWLNTLMVSYDTHSSSDIVFKVDIADTYGAGIEQYALAYNSDATLKDLPLLEMLTLNVEYTDQFDALYRVSLPVVSGSLEYAKAHSNGQITDNSRVVGYMQQGDSVIFGGRLPNLKEIKKCELRYWNVTAPDPPYEAPTGYSKDEDKSIWDRFTGAVGEMWDATKIAVDETLTTAGNLLHVVGDSLATAIGDIGGFLGTEAGMGFAETLLDKIALIPETVGSYAGDVVDWMRDEFAELTGSDVGINLFSMNLAPYDVLRISGFSVYNTNESRVSVKSELLNGIIVNTVDGDPQYYYTSFTEEGAQIPFDERLTYGSSPVTYQLQLLKYETGAKLSPRVAGDQYLLVLGTDNTEISGTEDDLMCTLKFTDVYGNNIETEEINARESMQNFFGYWPGADGDVAYRIGAKKGGNVYVLFSAMNVDYFTGVSIRLKSRASGSDTDEWQAKSLQILKLTAPLGKRICQWADVTDNTGAPISDRLFTRDIRLEPTANGAQNAIDISPATFAEGMKLLVQGSTIQECTFETGSMVQKGTDIDWGELRYSMSYSEATQGLGFKSSRAIYSVEVEVGGDTQTGGNGDCGSQNQFFFQLVFEQGKSGYVLANQQLSADGFRNGQKETFKVIMNQDYGRLTAIRIIPEDPNDPTANFDKLKIENIIVTKEGNEALSQAWTIAIGDWIGIDYVDTGAQSSLKGQPGRSEGELARTYLVTSSGYSINLLFALETGSYEDSAFDGALRATVRYYNIQGRLCSKNIDVIKEMYDYAHVTARYAEAKVDPKLANETPADKESFKQYAQIDPSFMLRATHTDRFVVRLPDVKSIADVTFHVADQTVAGVWNVVGLNIYRITSDGVMNVNSKDEYQSTAEVEYLCSSTLANGYRLFYPNNGTGESMSIELTENDIDVDINKGWVSTLDYLPPSKDDQINIYAFLSEKNDTSALIAQNMRDSYELLAAIRYDVSKATTQDKDGNTTTVEGGECQTLATLKQDAARNMFYAKGVHVSGITSIKEMALQSNSVYDTNTKVDHIVVEQVRSGVVIKTYYLNGGGASVEDSVGGKLIMKCAETSVSSIKGAEKQIVTLFLGENTKEMALHEKQNDIVVSIDYISSNDPTGAVVTSHNSFLSDQNGVTVIKPGQVIELEFNQDYVQEITSVTVTAIGTLAGNVDVAMAAAASYAEVIAENQKNNYWSNTGWFSFASPMAEIGLSPRRLQRTASSLQDPKNTFGSVTPVTITFKTDMSNGGSTADRISMKVVYGIQDGSVLSQTYDDVTRYLSSGSFRPTSSLQTGGSLQISEGLQINGSAQTGDSAQTGGSSQDDGLATVTLMMSDVRELYYIEVEPHDTDPYEEASWNLQDVTVVYKVNGLEREVTASRPTTKVQEGETTVSRVTTPVLEGEGAKLNVSSAVLSVMTRVVDEQTGVSDTRNTNSSAHNVVNILLEAGETVELRPTCEAPFDKFSYVCERVEKDATKLAGDCLKEVNGVLVFTAPENTGNQAQEYRVTIYSNEFEDTLYVTVSLTVDVKKSTPPAETEIQSADSGLPVDEGKKQTGDEEPEEEPTEGAGGDEPPKNPEDGESSQTTGSGETPEMTEGGELPEGYEGGEPTEVIEGGESTEVTEGGESTEVTEGGESAEAAEGGENAEITDSEELPEEA